MQTHRNENVHWYSGASWMLGRQLHRLTQIMQTHAEPRRAMLRALSLTNSTLNIQAQLWAYVDVLRYFALTCAICIPIAFLLKKPKAGSQGEA